MESLVKYVQDEFISQNEHPSFKSRYLIGLGYVVSPKDVNYIDVAPNQIASISDRDYWMKANEAKKYGMIDEVLTKK